MPRFPERLLRRTSVRRYILLLALLAGLLYGLGVPENPRLDRALNRAFPVQLDPRIVLVGIDDASLRDYGRLEVWPRALYAQAISNLNDAGAKVIGLDVILSDPPPDKQTKGDAFSRPDLVRSVTPEDFLVGPQQLSSPSGISVVNAPRLQGMNELQTAYSVGQDGTLLPSFAAQVARVAGQPIRFNTAAHLISYSPSDTVLGQVVSFRDVVNGNIRFADFQGRIVLIGVTASGLSNALLPDVDGRPIPGVALQAQAVSSLLAQEFQRPSRWLVALLCVALCVAALLLGGYWGFVFAAAVLLLSALSWRMHCVMPGVTLSLTAIAGNLLAAGEQWWQARRMRQLDPLTGTGNRLALNQMLEKRWRNRGQHPVTVVLAEVHELRRISDQYGRLAAERVLRDLAARLEQATGRPDNIFRWSPEEFAVVLPAGPVPDSESLKAHYQSAFAGFQYGDLPLHVNLGMATSTGSIVTPSELLEAANRHRYRQKFERERQRPAAVPAAAPTALSES